MYESKIGDARWIAYDLPGNAGWIAFLAGLILCAVKRPEITGNNAISAFLILNLLCAAAMVVGVIELISERIQKLDRVLPRRRLYRGFGALTFGGLAVTVTEPSSSQVAGTVTVSVCATSAPWYRTR